ncbi:hypothetical protein KKG41_05490 [Patescibacteria group bacterium]|nr:hypothetical protein [Patescibacteria group bacterium]MBU1890316.1 hypothetical protein [Patescibacteria group bacterium]
MIKNFQKNQAGATLILAILTMAAITAVAVAISVLILNEVITTRGITYSVKSFYSAEAATEQALWKVRDVQLSGGTIEDAEAVIDGMNGTLEDSRVSWERTAIHKKESISLNLVQDESVFLNVYDEGGLVPGIFRIEDCPLIANVEATWSGWDPALGFSDQTYKQYPVACDTDYTITQPVGHNQNKFSFQLRAFDNSVVDKEFIIKTVAGVPIEIPSEIQIISTGEYPKGGAYSAAQAIQVNFPWLLPISGVYSYVLFSDSELNKD